MTGPGTSIRLISIADSVALTEHLIRDEHLSRRWLPARPRRFFTVEGQSERILQLLQVHERGAGWPGVIESDGCVLGQVTVSSLVRFPVMCDVRDPTGWAAGTGNCLLPGR
jgi:ribosomal-protein-alanine N-acetyltransferase